VLIGIGAPREPDGARLPSADRAIAALRSYHGPLVGLRDVDEHGVLQSWLPRRETAAAGARP